MFALTLREHAARRAGQENPGEPATLAPDPAQGFLPPCSMSFVPRARQAMQINKI